MRNIKFRFYSEVHKEMILWSKINKNHLHHYLSNKIDNVLPMQFTGLRDKNGKEIYEGDLLGDWTAVDGKMVQSKMQVYFDESLGQWMLDCSFSQDKSNGYALFKELEDFKLEIIGNIHENPAL